MTPDWFTDVIAQTGEPAYCSIDATKIHYLHWKNEGKPGLIFIHGHAAHAHWWDFIAPFFLEDFDIVAIDLSGNGDSDHREQYSADLYAREIVTCAEVAGLSQPTIVGHSFGGSMARVAAHLYPDAFRGLIIVDSYIASKPSTRQPPPMPRPRERVYKSRLVAMRRFRLRPPQPCENQFVLDHIAYHSINETEKGFCFKLDSAVFAKMPTDRTLPAASEMVKALKIPAGFIYGKQSRFFPEPVINEMLELFDNNRVIGIDDAHHHVFLDQPLKFVSALKQLL